MQKITRERKAREDTEESILELLRDMVSRIKNEIECERRERETSEEQLLCLLEDTCSRLTQVATNQIVMNQIANQSSSKK